MCRHLAYLGAPIALSALVVDPPHSLVVQSYASVEMRGAGRINADGFGVAWFPDEGGDVVRYRRSSPIWSDASLPALARASRSGVVLAAVRDATVGMPVIETANAPFTDGRWLFSHNGFVVGWPATVSGLASALPLTDLMTLEAPTDSALLWALVRHRLAAGLAPAEAVRSVVLDVEAAAPGSRLNLLLLDSSQVVATTMFHSLSYRQRPGAVVVASEPLDQEPGWVPVTDRQLVVATADDIQIHPLEG